MSDQNAVWPDGAREAVQTVVYQWVRDQWGDSVDIAGLILATLAPYLQQRTQRMAEALSDINELVPPPPVGVSQSMADRLRLMVAQRDAQRGKSESLVAALRAEVARLREDGERRQSEVLQLRALVAALPIGECQASAALQGWWAQMKDVMEGTNPTWLVEPRGCPTPGACSCPGVRLDAARSARGEGA